MFSNSQGALQTLEAGRVSSILIVDCRNSLNALSLIKRLTSLPGLDTAKFHWDQNTGLAYHILLSGYMFPDRSSPFEDQDRATTSTELDKNSIKALTAILLREHLDKMSLTREEECYYCQSL
ncbi:hypothetical protein Trydic_g20782 [Trypoxylus dichotomus]